MSRIKILLAEEENIDDLKIPVRFNKDFADSIRDYDIRRIAAVVARWSKSMATEDYIADNAKFELGEDDDYGPVMFLENFTTLCDEIAEDHLNHLIEQEHLDLDDDMYKKILETASAELADFYADYESALCADALADFKRDNKYWDIK